MLKAFTLLFFWSLLVGCARCVLTRNALIQYSRILIFISIFFISSLLADLRREKLR